MKEKNDYSIFYLIKTIYIKDFFLGNEANYR